MKVQEPPQGVRISVRASLHTLLGVLVREGSGEWIWDFIHSSFKPVDQPVYSIDPRTGESVEGILMEVRDVTITPAAELAPDPDSTPDELYATHILLGEVPSGYRQEFPSSGASPKFQSGHSYFIRVWSTDDTERAVFTKR
jgi:hypothetical protein